MPNLSRRKLLQGTAALGGAAFATRVLAAAPSAEAVTPALIEAAKKEGKVVYYTSIDLPVAEKIKQFGIQIEQHNQTESAKLAWQRKLIESALARVVKAPENNIMAVIIESKLQAISRSEKQLEEITATSRLALDILKEYVFREPAKSLREQFNIPAGSSAIGGWR
jgi:hypothetical protein